MQRKSDTTRIKRESLSGHSSDWANSKMSFAGAVCFSSAPLHRRPSLRASPLEAQRAGAPASQPAGPWRAGSRGLPAVASRLVHCSLQLPRVQVLPARASLSALVVLRGHGATAVLHRQYQPNPALERTAYGTRSAPRSASKEAYMPPLFYLRRKNGFRGDR